MASLKRWGIGALLGCLALALAYLPPRGAKSSGVPAFFAQSPSATSARARAQALADEWRHTESALRLLTERSRLQALVRSDERPEPRSVWTQAAHVPAGMERLVDSAIQRAWQHLGLGETKVQVALILEMAGQSAARDRPALEEGRGMYLAPDTTNRTLCIVVLPLSRYWTRVVTDAGRSRVTFADVVRMFERSFGPCAFYAAYGTPGKPVRQWLVSRGWDLALTLDPGARGRQGNSLIGFAGPRFPWYWDAIYALPPSAVGCLAGRAAACRASVLGGADDAGPVSMPDIMRVERRWNRTQRLVEAQRFLADVSREVGRDRFLTFWTSPLRVDTALAAALKRPVGEWTADWQRDFVVPVRLGPAPRAGAVTIALALAVVALALVTLAATRRQVR